MCFTKVMMNEGVYIACTTTVMSKLAIALRAVYFFVQENVRDHNQY